MKLFMKKALVTGANGVINLNHNVNKVFYYA